MPKFQRARSEEQREMRRRAILDTAAQMLAEMPVSQLSLNELSRRVGLAKSNVLRYFESREAVLLELVLEQAHDLFIEAGNIIMHLVDNGDTAFVRARHIASLLARAYDERPMLCELLGAQLSILEHNVTTETIISFKRNGYQSLAKCVTAIHEAIPELTEAEAAEVGRLSVLLAGVFWLRSHPPQAVKEAYDIDPTLSNAPQGFVAAYKRALTIFMHGMIAGKI